MIERLQYNTDTTVDERYGTRTLRYTDATVHGRYSTPVIYILVLDRICIISADRLEDP